MEKYKVVIAVNYIHPRFLEMIAPYCEIIRQWKYPEQISENLLTQWISGAEGLVAGQGSPVTAKVLAQATNLKVITLPQTGYNEVDIAAATAYGIPVGHTPGVLTETVAELAMAITLCAARDLIPAHQFVLEGKWMEGTYPVFGMDLSRRTMGILGMGAIGISLSRRARACGMTVIYHNRHPRTDDTVRCTEYVTVDELLRRSDVLVAAMPLTDETRHMIDINWFKKMKKTAIFVNIARGGVVNTSDLITALQTGQIAKAALDVSEPEPLPVDHPLLALPHALVFPHIGSLTERTRRDMAELAARNLLKGLAGNALETCVNEKVNYSSNS